MKIYLLVSNLLSRQQIKLALPDYQCQYIKTLTDISEPNAKVVAELNEQSIQELKASLEQIKENNIEVLCFYPHQQVLLAEQALELGMKKLYVKSKFFGETAKLVNQA